MTVDVVTRKASRVGSSPQIQYLRLPSDSVVKILFENK